MNRAHAYKASVDQNTAKGVDPDDGISMGLFSIVLMAADILLFNAHKATDGRDQIQHLEMARDIAQRFNHIYGDDYFVLPEVVIAESRDPAGPGWAQDVKSCRSTPSRCSRRGGRATAVMRIVTDSAPASSQGCRSHLYVLYRAFAPAGKSAAFRQALEEGMGWKTTLGARARRTAGGRGGACANDTWN